VTMLPVRKLYRRCNQRSRHDIPVLSTNWTNSLGRLKQTTTRNATASYMLQNDIPPCRKFLAMSLEENVITHGPK